MAKKKNDLVETQDNPVTENKLTNSDITRHNLELFQLPYIDPYYKPEEGINRITEYLEICIKNNMKLIRIPYWNFDKIYDILDMVLSSKDVNINKIKECANG